jgi:glucose uptake protein
MIIPQTYLATLALLIIGMLCWGLWANTVKAAGKWRFELYYFDFAMGLVIASLIGALTFGSLGFDGFSFTDDVLHAGKKQDMIGAAAGLVFNLGNMLLVAAITEIGLSIAFPVAIGVAIIVSSLWNFLLIPAQNPALLFSGAAIVFVAVVIATIAYRLNKLSKIDELVRTGKQKSTRKRVSSKGLIIAIGAGLFIGSYSPIVAKAMEGEIGLGAYSVTVMFAIGVLLSTFLFNLFFMNLPVSGPPLEIFDYFKGTLQQHAWGLLGGFLWYIGIAAVLVSAATEGAAKAEPAMASGLAQGATVLATLSGLLYWGEFKGSEPKVRALLVVMVTLLVCGIGLVALAPGWTKS